MLGDCIKFFLQKKVRLACNRELEFACVQENGKFQSFRCSDTEIELEIAGEQLKQYLMCFYFVKTDVHHNQGCMTMAQSLNSVTITFQRANFIWSFRYFKRQSQESSQNVHSERKKIVFWKTKSGISINPNISIVKLYHMCGPS